ncbi:murein biosynthesis integral membrane protein MurJ [Actinoallomurus purpureus]|uniref:murein biosynthesis integral membrane protein MurJ n=1 Tax=Actinoallomurus purpureus TaxID=478114 RepID=UPI002092AA2F|nr:murein biosynthesis integral membrane protein MurJ [Actinoallomurus purpureus]MCO6007294.1 murein biosynthesis integral membrane protein MurJ [Actinoallomurus purpureus]
MAEAEPSPEVAVTATDLPTISPEEPGEEPGRGRGGVSGLLKSSAVMALGTVASRLTGFIRTAVLVVALGTQALGDVYNTANTFPNVIYDLLLGGVLTAVHVPMLVRALEKDRKYGEEYEARLLTLVLGALLALTAVAMLCAPLLVDLYASSYNKQKHDLAVLFALFFLPQIFFYGVGALAGASLNARGSFGAPMWTPVLNNVIVIAVGLGFLFVAGPGVNPGNITHTEVILLAGGTTLGIVIQTIAMWPSLRKVGFRYRPRFDFRREELAPVGGMALWTLLYVAIQQVGFVVNTNIANSAGQRGSDEGIPYGVGLTPWSNAYLLFQLPYAIVGVSVVTALLPQMSRHASDRRFDLVRENMSSALNLSSVVIVPSAALLFALAPELTTLFFAHGSTQISGALMIANVLQAFTFALVPFAIYQLLLRVFYALADTRTPAMMAIFNVAISISLGLVGYYTLPTNMIVEGISIALGVSWTFGCVVAALILRRRLNGLGARHIVTSHLKIAIATIPAFGFALAVHLLSFKFFYYHVISSLGVLVIGGGGAMVLYFLVARVMRVPEVESLQRTLMARLPGRGAS